MPRVSFPYAGVFSALGGLMAGANQAGRWGTEQANERQHAAQQHKREMAEAALRKLEADQRMAIERRKLEQGDQRSAFEQFKFGMEPSRMEKEAELERGLIRERGGEGRLTAAQEATARLSERMYGEGREDTRLGLRARYAEEEGDRERRAAERLLGLKQAGDVSLLGMREAGESARAGLARASQEGIAREGLAQDREKLNLETMKLAMHHSNELRRLQREETEARLKGEAEDAEEKRSQIQQVIAWLAAAKPTGFNMNDPDVGKMIDRIVLRVTEDRGAITPFSSPQIPSEEDMYNQIIRTRLAR